MEKEITVSLSEELATFLNTVAKESDKSRDDIVKEALCSYLVKQKEDTEAIIEYEALEKFLIDREVTKYGLDKILNNAALRSKIVEDWEKRGLLNIDEFTLQDLIDPNR